MVAPKEVKELVERFERHIDAYKSGKYKESQLRSEFIDPFFEALGWDVNNKQGYAEAYKDIIREDSIKVAGGTKAPDYCFRIGGQRKFFVEAKKPSINIKNEPSAAYQVRRYAWSSKLPLSILTDFEELAIYDCLLKPSNNDSASFARVNYYTYKEYIDQWDEIYSIFSKEAVQKGSFDKYVEMGKRKRGTTEVDDVFLKEIEGWREAIAKNIAVNNSKLSQEELNFVVQKMIDRIIFLRICEDRHIEDYGRLMALLNGSQVYERLAQMFRQADDKYNSGLFHFQEEKERPEHFDGLSLKLKLDDDVLKEIIKGLYYPESPYEFSVLPADILGHVYEQFLGKVIRLTAGHRAVIEEKPEVRKAGGIYYTPTYIVDYIVKNTVGKLLEDKTPEKVSTLRVLDPACGSGSFLIQAYQYMLDWHLDYYIKSDPQKYTTKKKAALFKGSKGEWLLTTGEKKRILLNNIYGVDVDSQAGEVTKLSLLLKVLEGETEQTINSNLRLFHERALPDLGDNIKCGNSLIGSDIYENRQLSMIDDNEKNKINAFDWNIEFPEVFTKKNPGFDVVLGNPPWGGLLNETEKQYLSKQYINRRGEAESHLFFIEKGFRLLTHSGKLGFITPNTWLAVLNSKEIRQYLLSNATFYEICELSKYIFEDAPDIVPVLVFLENSRPANFKCLVKRSKHIKINEGNIDGAFSCQKIAQSVWDKSPNSVINLRADVETMLITKKCTIHALPLSDICDVLYGIKTGNNQKFISKSLTNKHKMKALKTAELSRYDINWKGIYLWWTPELAGYRTIPVNIPKIIVQYIRKLSMPRRIIAALDQEGIFYPLNNYSYITPKIKKYSLEYILGILNSSLLNYYYANNFIDYNIKPTYLQKLPIHAIDFNRTNEKDDHDKIVSLVGRMLNLKKRLHRAKLPHENESILREIEATDRQIDQLAYKLYGLTEEEIRVVEGK
jgi:type I restriction-modification system DNA methylase subunit